MFSRSSQSAMSKSLIMVVSGRWSNFLPSDLDERNEIVGTARHGFLAFCLCRVSSWLPKIGILQIIPQSSKRQYRAFSSSEWCSEPVPRKTYRATKTADASDVNVSAD